MNALYRQFQRGESLLLTQPHRLLDYLNLQLVDPVCATPSPWPPCCLIRRTGWSLPMPG